MNTKRYTARMLSRFKTGLDSWISLWRFLVYLEDLNFYEGLDGCETERTDRYVEQATFTRRLKSDRARSPAAAVASHGSAGEWVVRAGARPDSGRLSGLWGDAKASTRWPDASPPVPVTSYPILPLPGGIPPQQTGRARISKGT
jgi:hypothetical protein